MRKMDLFDNSTSIKKKATPRVGEIFYRVFDAKDGGGYFAQPLKVLAVTSDSVIFQLFDGSSVTLCRTDESKLYTSQFDCKRDCWKLNGTGDPFEQLCRHKGITSEQDRAKELAEQMEIWGARDYEDLLHSLV